MRHLTTSVVLLLSLSLGGRLFACLWDVDTLAVERQRFPDALELITGKFARHSTEFYRWRVKDRQAKIASDGTKPRHYDDLAVAYDKLGQQDKAIEMMLAKDELFPGEYETEANLGTFYIHSGDFEKGIEHIEKAIEINPDAHFGREVFQKLLVEYVLSKRGEEAGAIALPLDPGTPGEELELSIEIWRRDEIVHEQAVGFARFVEEKGYTNEDALRGVLGMMRFGHFDSPILLEAVGDLLLATGEPNEDGKRLAARAYLKASYEVDDEDARVAYRKMAQHALWMQTVSKNSLQEIELDAVERTFKEELADARQWYSEVHNDELEWIRAGKNPEEEFTRKYYTAPVVASPSDKLPAKFWILTAVTLVTLVGLGLWVARSRWQSSLPPVKDIKAKPLPPTKGFDG